jgi:hypothetical protein
VGDVGEGLDDPQLDGSHQDWPSLVKTGWVRQADIRLDAERAQGRGSAARCAVRPAQRHGRPGRGLGGAVAGRDEGVTMLVVEWWTPTQGLRSVERT